MSMTRRQAYFRLGIIVIIFAALGLVYNIAVPLHKAPDEIAHFMYSRFIAETGRLPLNNEEREQAGFLSFWPPGYHAAVAALVGWQAGTELPRLKFTWESLRFELARELLDTKRLANTEDELWPFRGDVLLWHLGRGVSLLFGIGIILVAFATALTVWPGNYRLAVWCSAIIAFIPTFLFISSMMNYESLLGLVSGLYLLLLLKIVRGDTRLRLFVGLGLLLGLSVTVKYTTVILPLEVLVILGALAWTQRTGWSCWPKWVTTTGLAAMVASAWWFVYLVVYFNEIDRFGPVVGTLKPIIAGGIDASQNYIAAVLTGNQIGTLETLEITPDPLWAWALRMFQSFWGRDIGGFVLWPWAYLLAGAVLAASLVGLVRLWRAQLEWRFLLGVLVFHLLLFFGLPLLRFLVQGNISWTAQGRHALFPVATTLPLLLVFGWRAWDTRTHQLLALAFVGGLLGWSLVQLVRASSYYPPPLPVRTVDQSTTISMPLDLAVGDHLRLVGYNTQLIPAEGALKLSLFWQSPTYPDQDYRLAVRVLQNKEIMWRWLGYPVNGQYPTRVWEAGETIRDDIYLPLLDLPPGENQIQIQMLSAAGPLSVGENQALTITVAIPKITPPPPNIPLSVSVEGRPVVTGVSLWQAGRYRLGTLPEYLPRMAVTLVWQGQPAPGQRVDWLLVAEDGQLFPAETASEHGHYFLVGGDWPAGNYRLRIEVWQAGQVVASQETGVVLAVKNERPRRFELPAIDTVVNANFGDVVELLGYDLPLRVLERGQGVPVTLYWRGRRTTDVSYTVFVKLLDERQQAWSSLDRFPADGYQTIYWLENEVVVDGFELPVAEDTPDGVYWLNVGLYQEENGTAVSLPLMFEDQPIGETSITFGPVKIGGPPPGTVVGRVTPDQPLHITFGDPIRLVGHNAPLLAPGQVQLELFWESVQSVPIDYTVFVHVRDRTGEVVAQKDRPPLNGRYPTSVWTPGELIPDLVTVPLPDDLPAGRYSLAVGLYDFNTGQRLPVPGSPDNSLKLTDITVE